MKEKDKDNKQPLMSGIEVLKLIESIGIIALIIVAGFSFYAVLFKGAYHQLIIGAPCLILAFVLTWDQVRDRKEKKNDTYA